MAPFYEFSLRAEISKARQLFEDLLVEDRQGRSGVGLQFFNLSRADSAQLFDRALDAFLNHQGWKELLDSNAGENELFGHRCPIRHNYELLRSELVRSRLRSLLELCDHNGLHVPVRQILLLLTNAVLGHPDAKDGLMTGTEVPSFIGDGITSKASLFNNVFGGNLIETRRLGFTIFDYLQRFQIGHETSNRVDNLLIFGEQDEHLKHYFETLVGTTPFMGQIAGSTRPNRNTLKALTREAIVRSSSISSSRSAEVFTSKSHPNGRTS